MSDTNSLKSPVEPVATTPSSVKIDAPHGATAQVVMPPSATEVVALGSRPAADQQPFVKGNNDRLLEFEEGAPMAGAGTLGFDEPKL